jgi:outer membrane protein OmpA-like peptidoglycan-associated protein
VSEPLGAGSAPLGRDVLHFRVTMLARETAQPQAPTHPHRGVDRPAAEPAVRGLRAAADPGVAHHLGSGPPAAFAEVASVLARAGGRPLHAGARAELEPLVGRDLGDVRVHDDAVAARSAEAVGAQAYTAGKDVVFGAGRYAPETAEGRGVIAHEVGHVVGGQGGGGTVLRAPLDPAAKALPKVPEPRVAQIGSATVATVYFAHDVFVLEPSGFAAVQKLAEQVSFMAKPMVSVDGYASTEGPPARNVDLARMRRELVVALLKAKASALTYGGAGHGSADPVVPETARDPSALEAQRAQNRRVTIVILELSTPSAQPPPKVPKPWEWQPKPETEDERTQREIRESLKHEPPTRPKRTIGEMGRKVVDDWLSKHGVEKKYRDRIEDALGKGFEKAVDATIDATPLSPAEKEAVKSLIKSLPQQPL